MGWSVILLTLAVIAGVLIAAGAILVSALRPQRVGVRGSAYVARC